jgi:hypothetical protein
MTKLQERVQDRSSLLRRIRRAWRQWIFEAALIRLIRMNPFNYKGVSIPLIF